MCAAVAEPVVRIPMPLAHQLGPLLSTARFKVVVCGRRFGKTTMGLIACLEGHGPPGCHKGALEGGRIWWVQPTFPDALEVWTDLKAACKELLAAGLAHKSEIDRRMTFVGGGSITIKSADREGSLRGVGLDGIVFDEACQMLEDRWTKSARAAVIDRRGWVMFLTTPKGYDWIRVLFLKADGGLKNWECWKRPTYDNPLIHPDEIEQMALELGRDSIEFLQEVDAEFIEGIGTVFKNILEVCSLPFREVGQGLWEGKPPRETRRYISGLDFGATKDATVLSVFDPVLREQVALLQLFAEPWDYVKTRIAEVLDMYPGVVYADATSLGSIAVAEVQRKVNSTVKAVTFTQPQKHELVSSLRIAFDTITVKLLGVKPQMIEFEAFEAKRLPAGGIRYSHPSGLHDDTVMSAGLAIVNLGTGVLQLPPDLGEDRRASRQATWRDGVRDVYDTGRGTNALDGW